jgi:hypothetical protein
MSTSLKTRPRPDDTDTGTPRVAHIVEGKDKVTRAYVTGEPVTALCGKKWVPSRNPDGLPVCKACVAELERRRGGG